MNKLEALQARQEKIEGIIERVKDNRTQLHDGELRKNPELNLSLPEVGSVEYIKMAIRTACMVQKIDEITLPRISTYAEEVKEQITQLEELRHHVELDHLNQSIWEKAVCLPIKETRKWEGKKEYPVAVWNGKEITVRGELSATVLGTISGAGDNGYIDRDSLCLAVQKDPNNKSDAVGVHNIVVRLNKEGGSLKKAGLYIDQPITKIDQTRGQKTKYGLRVKKAEEASPPVHGNGDIYTEQIKITGAILKSVEAASVPLGITAIHDYSKLQAELGVVSSGENGKLTPMYSEEELVKAVIDTYQQLRMGPKNEDQRDLLKKIRILRSKLRVRGKVDFEDKLKAAIKEAQARS